VSRHPIHRDVINPGLLDQLPQIVRDVTPLDLGGPLIEVVTDEPFDPDDLIGRVRERL